MGFIRPFLVFLFVFLLSACLGGETNVESGNRTGVLHFGNVTEPQTLDPHIATGMPEHRILGALFEGLVSKDPATLELEPGAAESWTLSDDGKVYTFTIRKDALWSNGDALTAHDFEWSWWRLLQPALGSQYVFMLFPVKNAERYFRQEITDFSQVGVKALDRHTLQVELANPTPYFLQLLDHYSTFPLHRATIEKYGAADESYTRWTRPKNMVSNGPFTLDEWQLFKVLSVKKNNSYWGSNEVKLNAIRFYPVDKETTEERMFRAGQLHATRSVPIDRIPWYRENHPELIHVTPYVGTYFYRFNLTKPALADVRVRRALAMSVDRTTLINTVLNGIFTPAYAVTPPGLLGYQPPKLVEYDPEGARKLMAEAGYPNGKGYPGFEFQYNTSESHRKIAIAVQQMWKKTLNIDVTLQNKDWKVYLDDEASKNYEVSRGSWIGDYLDPNTFIDMWTSGSGVNRTGYSDPEYDELVLQKAPKQKTHAERLKVFFEAETLLMQAMPILPIYTYSDRQLQHPSAKGMPPNYMAYFNFRKVQLIAESETVEAAKAIN